MMDRFLKRMLKQTIVYWGSPEIGGMGGVTYASPVEIDGRWEDKKELVVDNNGQEVVSNARVWVTQDLDEGGCLYLGTLSDSCMDSEPVPTEIENAREIIGFAKIPGLGSTSDYVRKAYLR